MLFDRYSVRQVNEAVERIRFMLENGLPKKRIRKGFSEEDFAEFFSMAQARIKDNKGLGSLFYTKEDLRWATNRVVADYRAGRLRCDVLVEIGCGVGVQTLAFAKTCKKVIAIEIDERKLSYAIANAEINGVDNVKFILGDALYQDVEGDIIFVDFERDPSAKRRHVDDLLPHPKRVVEKFGKDMCFEFPPQMRNIPFDCEKEYVSVDGALNRLNLYFGKLKKAEYSAVALPSADRLERDDELVVDERKKALRFIYELDNAVVVAGLASKVADAPLFKGKFLTSDKILESVFFKNRFEVLHQLTHNVKKEIELLNQENAGDVILRMKIDPKLYWREREKYKRELNGKEKLYLFVFNKTSLIVKKL